MKWFIRAGRAGSRRGPSPGAAGTALIVALVATVILVGLAGAVISIGLGQNRSTENAKSREIALSLAESGLDHVIFRMSNWATDPTALAENTDVVLGGGTFRFEVAPDFAGTPGQYTITSVGTFSGVRRRIEAVVAPLVSPLFGGAAFGRTGVRFDSNARTDGYNSSLGSYDSQAVNGSGSNRYANTTGDIGTNGDIQLASNTKIWGNATPGPGGTVVGAAGRVSGSTAAATAPKVLPAVTLPPAAALPGVSQNYNGNGSYTIESGDHHFSQFTADSNVTITVNGPATIVVDSFELKSNITFNINGANGPVKIYGTGKFVIDSNVTVNNLTQKPSDLEINLTTNNQSGSPPVELNSNTRLFGTIYAPDANIELDSNGELFGAVIANYVSANSNYRIHYDEALSAGVAGPYRARNWREVAPR